MKTQRKRSPERSVLPKVGDSYQAILNLDCGVAFLFTIPGNVPKEQLVNWAMKAAYYRGVYDGKELKASEIRATLKL